MENSSDQQFCLRWNNHLPNMVELFDELLGREAFTDAYIACDNGDIIKCHKLILAACSPYFANLLTSTPENSPLIHVTTVHSDHMRSLVDYMYRGEVNVAQEELPYLLEAGEFLQIKGLSNERCLAPELANSPTKMRIRRIFDDTPNPDISTSTMSYPEAKTEIVNSHNSPPHSTSSPYTPYGKSPMNRNHNQTRQSTPAYNLPYPGQNFAHLHHRASQLSVEQAEFFAAHYKALNSHKDLANLIPPDTPILRGVLGQGHADSSQEAVISVGHDYCSASNASPHEDVDLRRNSMDLSPAHSSSYDPMDTGSKKLSPKSCGGNNKQRNYIFNF